MPGARTAVVPETDPLFRIVDEQQEIRKHAVSDPYRARGAVSYIDMIEPATCHDQGNLASAGNRTRRIQRQGQQ